jgi:hypothetical protein
VTLTESNLTDEEAANAETLNLHRTSAFLRITGFWDFFHRPVF